MRRLLRALTFSLACASTATVPAEEASRLVRDSARRTPEEERSGFHLPAGFEVQLFADDAQLGGKPINMAFDTRGRLWVTSTQEYPYAVKKEKWSPDTTRALGSKDTIRILEDRDGDGRADLVTIFADDLNIPTGLQPYKNGCIAWSIPNILFLEDTQHEGRAEKADQRRILFGPLGYEKDTHGMISSMRLGLDGWIYATHGFSNTSHFAVRPDNARRRNDEGRMTNDENASLKFGATSASTFVIPHSSLDITSGSVFRFKPDGSSVELWTSGQVNPFGLCWDSWGNLYSADCHSSPIYQLIRGAEYPHFGNKPGPLGYGPAMCEHAHGSTGICGPVYLDGGVWGPEWDDHMFVCNPVTSKINHDHITFTGSTPKANEQPDFLTSDDGWFRPVDLQLGPDGALYIADFYNKIIGHYEVPLDHPDRDRSSGRIWRVVRKGVPRAITSLGRTEDTTHFVAAKFNRALISRYFDRFTVHDLAGLVVLLGATPREDTHLRAAARVALRKILSLPEAFAALSPKFETPARRDELIRISCAVPTADAATWLLDQLRAPPATKERDLPSPGPTNPRTEPVPLLGMDRALLTQVFTHIARHLPAAREGELVSLVQQHFGDDLDMQLDLFAAVREGRNMTNEGMSNVERASRKSGGASDSSLVIRHSSFNSWATTLAKRLTDWLSEKRQDDWLPPKPQASGPSPWFRLARPCADGQERPMLDSHPPGGEKLTGTLRSKTFDLPPTLSFWLAGHRGFPTATALEKSFVRLIDADTRHEVALAFPPRHNTARRITWQTGKMPAKRGYLELVDGDDGTAYAWLAAGGFEPAVVGIPELGSPGNDKRIRQAAELALLREQSDGNGTRKSAYPDLEKALTKLPQPDSYSPDTRVALARLRAVATADPAELPELARDPDLAAPLFAILEDDSADHGETAKAFKTLASPAQIKLASALAGSKQTAGTLLKSAPPRVLADPLVTGKLKALGDATLTQQLADITAKLPPQNDAVNALIAARLKSYDPAKADGKRGELVFMTACMVCHRIGVRGNLVGPQLDGIGARGPERLLEDILDPNRAVDPAFRLHIAKLKSGGLMTGLLRREQGDSLIFADAAGQEHIVGKGDLSEDQVSQFSLMPSGLGEALTEEQVHDLLEYLLDRR